MQGTIESDVKILTELIFELIDTSDSTPPSPKPL
jgi:hypothetical protein